MNVANEPNPWLTPGEKSETALLEPISSGSSTTPAPAAASVVEATGSGTHDGSQPMPVVETDPQAEERRTFLQRRIETRSRRLVVANVATSIAALIAAFLVTQPWWQFTSPAGSLAIPMPGGGFRTVTVNAASATLTGTQAGGTMLAVMLLAAAAVSVIGSRRRWWPMAAFAVVLVAPWGPGAPPASPPASVAQPYTMSATYTQAAEGLRMLRVVWWVVVLLLVVVALQTFVVHRAQKAAERAENPEQKSPLARAVDKYVTASLARIGVEVAERMREQPPATDTKK